MVIVLRVTRDLVIGLDQSVHGRGDVPRPCMVTLLDCGASAKLSSERGRWKGNNESTGGIPRRARHNPKPKGDLR